MKHRLAKHEAGGSLAAILALTGGTHLAGPGATAAAETWRGLVVAPEDRCTPYDRRSQYPYRQSVEAKIIEGMGGRIYGPYTGRSFTSRCETDIEHMVATSEAHDSGLCAANPETRRRFASDLDNLTLAGPQVNRRDKAGKDAGEWLPPLNACWFAARVVEVKREYGLTADRREARALGGTRRPSGPSCSWA